MNSTPQWMTDLVIWIGIGFLLIMGALCVMLLQKMWKNEIDLSGLLDEANGEASVSRFQLLVFSLVFAVGFFLFILKNKTLPDIPNSVLTLLGISAATYAAGKGIQFSRPEGLMRSPIDPAVTPSTTPVPPDPAAVASSASDAPPQA